MTGIYALRLGNDADFVSLFERLCSVSRYGQNPSQQTEEAASEPLRDAARSATYLAVDYANGQVKDLREVSEISSDINGIKRKSQVIGVADGLTTLTFHVAEAATMLVDEIGRRVKEGLACGADFQAAVNSSKLAYPIRRARRKSEIVGLADKTALLPAPR